MILGVSGGPDSVYLLNLCLQAAKKRHFKIIVAHVNHRLRGKASDGDEAFFVRSLCAKEKLRFELKKLGKITGNLEEGSRNARYAFFEKLRQKYNANWIITAHHHGDNVETVLYNLVRGSFLSGLKGMDPVAPERYLLRPLLGITKNEILAFLHGEKIDYRPGSEQPGYSLIPQSSAPQGDSAFS